MPERAARVKKPVRKLGQDEEVESIIRHQHSCRLYDRRVRRRIDKAAKKRVAVNQRISEHENTAFRLAALLVAATEEDATRSVSKELSCYETKDATVSPVSASASDDVDNVQIPMSLTCKKMGGNYTNDCPHASELPASPKAPLDSNRRSPHQDLGRVASPPTSASDFILRFTQKKSSERLPPHILFLDWAKGEDIGPSLSSLLHEVEALQFSPAKFSRKAISEAMIQLLPIAYCNINSPDDTDTSNGRKPSKDVAEALAADKSEPLMDKVFFTVVMLFLVSPPKQNEGLFNAATAKGRALYIPYLLQHYKGSLNLSAHNHHPRCLNLLKPYLMGEEGKLTGGNKRDYLQIDITAPADEDPIMRLAVKEASLCAHDDKIPITATTAVLTMRDDVSASKGAKGGEDPLVTTRGMRKKKDLFPDVSLAVAVDVEPHFSSLHVATNNRKLLSKSNTVQKSLIMMTAEEAKAPSPQPPQFLLGATFPSSPDLEKAVYPSSLGADHHDIKRRRSPNNNMPEPCCTALAVSSTPNKAATCSLQTGLMLRDNVCTSRLLHNQEASCSARQCKEVDECLLSGGLKAGRAFPLGKVSDNMTHEEAEMDRLTKQNKVLSDSLAEMTLRCKSLFIQNAALQKKVEILSDAVKDAEQIAVQANLHANDNAMKINSLTSRHLETALNGLEDAGDTTAQDN